jgi:hypothetical protein
MFHSEYRTIWRLELVAIFRLLLPKPVGSRSRVIAKPSFAPGYRKGYLA